MKVAPDNTISIIRKREERSYFEKEIPIQEIVNILGYLNNPIGRSKYPNLIPEFEKVNEWLLSNQFI